MEKTNTLPYITKCNETSLDLKTVVKVVVFIEILSSILGLSYCTVCQECAKWKEWTAEKSHL